MPGEKTATVIAAIPKVLEMASRFQPNAAWRGAIKRLKVNGTIAAKLNITPKNAARTTAQPRYRRDLSGVSCVLATVPGLFWDDKSIIRVTYLMREGLGY